MTILFSDDFSTGDISKWTSGSGAPVVQGTVYYSAPYALALPYFEPDSGYVYYAFSEPYPTKMVAEFMFRVDHLPTEDYTGMHVFDCKSSNDEQLASIIFCPPGGGLMLFIATSQQGDYIANPISVDTWYKMKIEVDTVAGTMKLYVDDTELLSLSSSELIDISAFWFSSNILFEDGYSYFDDVVVTDGEGGATQVSKYVILKYNDLEDILNTLKFKSSVRNNLLKQFSSLWNNLETTIFQVSKDFISKSSNLSKLLSDIILKYNAKTKVYSLIKSVNNLLTKVTNDISLLYKSKAEIDSILRVLYNSRGSLSKSFNLKYNVKQLITQSISSLYKLKDVISNAITSSYGNLSVIVRKYSSLFNVRFNISKIISYLYLIKNNIDNKLSYVYNIKNNVSTVINSLYSLKYNVVKTLKFTYKLSSVIIKYLSGLHDVIKVGVIFKDLVFKNDIIEKLSKSFSANHSLKTLLIKYFVALNNVRYKISLMLTSLYKLNVYGYLTTTFTAKYNSLNNVTVNMISISKIRYILVKHITSLYDILTKLFVNLTSLNNIIMTVQKNIMLNYISAQLIIKKLTSKFIIGLTAIYEAIDIIKRNTLVTILIKDVQPTITLVKNNRFIITLVRNMRKKLY